MREIRNVEAKTHPYRKGLLASEGQEWQELRSKVQQPMLRPRSTLRYTPDLEAVADDFIKHQVKAKLNKLNQTGSDFLQDLYKWGLESVSILALHTRLGCLDPDLAKDSQQMKIIKTVSFLLEGSVKTEIGFPIWKYIPSPTYLKLKTEHNLFRQLCQGYIQKALEEFKNKPKDDTSDPTLLELFLEKGCNEAEAVTMATDMMFAGNLS